MKNNNSTKILLDEEEKLLLSSFENDEWQSVKNIEQQKARTWKAASNYLTSVRCNKLIVGSVSSPLGVMSPMQKQGSKNAQQYLDLLFLDPAPKQGSFVAWIKNSNVSIVLTGSKTMSFLAKSGNPKNNLQRLLDIIDSRVGGNDILVIHATKPRMDDIGAIKPMSYIELSLFTYYQYSSQIFSRTLTAGC